MKSTFTYLQICEFYVKGWCTTLESIPKMPIICDDINDKEKVPGSFRKHSQKNHLKIYQIGKVGISQFLFNLLNNAFAN